MTARRRWAWPLVPLYLAGLRAKDVVRAARIVPTRHLTWPVISVGSLSAGGAGKTPVVIALARLLKQRGWIVDVLSRGYGRTGRSVEKVSLEAPSPARRFGDEPVLIAASSGVPVWVGSNRFAAGLAAEANAQARDGVHLLDDGFQHRKLSRTVDIVLLTAQDLSDALLPAGNLREPLTALRRAGAIVVNEAERRSIEPHLRRLIGPEVPVWSVRRTLMLPAELEQSSRPCVAFCGIARPEGFFCMLRDCGLTLAAAITFPDHHRYTSGDVSRLVESCHLEGGGAFVTTEKDAVKIGPELRAALVAVAPFHVAGLDVRFVSPEDVLRGLEARLR